MFEKIHVEIVYDWEFDHNLQDVFSSYSTFGSDSSNNKKPLQLEFGIRSDQNVFKSRQCIATFPAGWSPQKVVIVRESYPKIDRNIQVKDLW